MDASTPVLASARHSSAARHSGAAAVHCGQALLLIAPSQRPLLAAPALVVCAAARPPVFCSERHSLASHREAQQAEVQARLQEDLLAQRAALEGQQAVQQAQLDKERAVVRVSSRGSAAAVCCNILPHQQTLGIALFKSAVAQTHRLQVACAGLQSTCNARKARVPK